MVAVVTNAPKRRGLKKGQRHSGSFGSPGRDPVAAVQKANAIRWSKDRRTVVAMAQEARPEAFATVLEIMRDPMVEPPTRLRAGELVLNYSDGKPRMSVDVNIGAPRDLSMLTTAELEAIAAGAPPPFALQYRGEVIEAEVVESVPRSVPVKKAREK